MKRVVRGVYEDEPLPEEQETEGQRQLHSLLLQQLNTEINLERCVAKKKCFAPAALYKPFGEQAAGVRSLAQFQQLQDGERELDHLRELGLTNTEIELWRSKEMSENTRKKQGVCAAPEAQDERLQVIRDKMAARAELLAKPQRFSDSRALTRREMEIERALFQGNDRCTFLTALYHHEQDFQNSQQGAASANSIDSLYRDLLKDEQKNSDTVTSADSIPPHRLDVSQTGSRNEPVTLSDPECGPSRGPEVRASTSLTSEQKQEQSEEKGSRLELPQQIGRLNGSWSRSRSPVTVCGKLEEIRDEEIRSNREEDEMIKRIPRFHNYQPGEPSHVLCVKNISPQASLAQLVSLFCRFQKDEANPVLYRLLTGRLKGQAFITFADKETAQAALDMVHGYKLLDKPLVIEFARERSNSKRENASGDTYPATSDS